MAEAAVPAVADLTVRQHVGPKPNIRRTPAMGHAKQHANLADRFAMVRPKPIYKYNSMKKKSDIVSRRNFFKKAAKATLPIIATAVLLNNPVIAQAKETEMGCSYGCAGGCSSGCYVSCSSGCLGTCIGSCKINCDHSCRGTCRNSCQGSCQGSCSYSSYY